MDEIAIEKIVREVVQVLSEKGLITTSPQTQKNSPSPVSVAQSSDSLAPSFQTTHAPQVTIGTAGKIFTGAPGGWHALPKPGPIKPEMEMRGRCPSCGPLEKITLETLKSLGADRVGMCHPSVSAHPIAQLIDHTLLRPNATRQEIVQLCEEAKKFCFASVCVNPSYVALASEILKGSGVKVCTVVGFPLGSTTPTVKAIEARDAIANGADEIDMVINVGALKSGNFQLALDDLRTVREATQGKILKVIIETALLSDEEKKKACRLAKESGADFVKTSTGFSGGGATVGDVRLMREAVGPKMGIKASGGVKDLESAQKLVAAGATRIGASASVSIATEKQGLKF